MSGNQTVIVYAKRTAIGKMSGAFSKVTAPNLAANRNGFRSRPQKKQTSFYRCHFRRICFFR